MLNVIPIKNNPTITQVSQEQPSRSNFILPTTTNMLQQPIIPKPAQQIKISEKQQPMYQPGLIQQTIIENEQNSETKQNVIVTDTNLNINNITKIVDQPQTNPPINKMLKITNITTNNIQQSSVKQLSAKITNNIIKLVDENMNDIGSITIESIFKYIASPYNTKNEFIKELSHEEYEKQKALIKLFLFKLVYNKSNEYVDVELMDFSNSGIMSNLELLIRLNDCIYDFYQTKFQSLLHVFDNNTRDKIVMLTNKFIY